MTDKYNFLHGASHFLPFSWGTDNHVQYSYTKTQMFCKQRLDAGDCSFEYVEVRDLDENDKEQLDALSAGDFVEPGRIFNRRGVGYVTHRLDELVGSYRQSAAALERLIECLRDMDSNSEEYTSIDGDITAICEDMSETENEIRDIIHGLNLDSGYNPETGEIPRFKR